MPNCFLIVLPFHQLSAGRQRVADAGSHKPPLMLTYPYLVQTMVPGSRSRVPLDSWLDTLGIKLLISGPDDSR